jgi:hypothetical protein
MQLKVTIPLLISIFLCILYFSKEHEIRHLGTWNINLKKTKSWNSENCKLTEKQTYAHTQLVTKTQILFTKNTITFTSQEKEFIINKERTAKLIAFEESFQYEILSSDENTIAIKIKDFMGEDSIDLIHFDDENNLWLYEGNTGFIYVNTREFYKKAI